MAATLTAIRDSIARMQQLGVGGTPLTLIGLTPAAGAPMKVVSSVYGARPYADFKTAIDAAHHARQDPARVQHDLHPDRR